MHLKLFARDEFYPNIDFCVFLNVANNRTKLEIFFSRLGLRNFKTHGKLTCILDD